MQSSEKDWFFVKLFIELKFLVRAFVAHCVDLEV
jgi:hypothetical protein